MSFETTAIVICDEARRAELLSPGRKPWVSWFHKGARRCGTDFVKPAIRLVPHGVEQAFRPAAKLIERSASAAEVLGPV